MATDFRAALEEAIQERAFLFQEVLRGRQDVMRHVAWSSAVEHIEQTRASVLSGICDVDDGPDYQLEIDEAADSARLAWYALHDNTRALRRITDRFESAKQKWGQQELKYGDVTRQAVYVIGQRPEDRLAKKIWDKTAIDLAFHLEQFESGFVPFDAALDMRNIVSIRDVAVASGHSIGELGRGRYEHFVLARPTVVTERFGPGPNELEELALWLEAADALFIASDKLGPRRIDRMLAGEQNGLISPSFCLFAQKAAELAWWKTPINTLSDFSTPYDMYTVLAPPLFDQGLKAEPPMEL